MHCYARGRCSKKQQYTLGFLMLGKTMFGGCFTERVRRWKPSMTESRRNSCNATARNTHSSSERLADEIPSSLPLYAMPPLHEPYKLSARCKRIFMTNEQTLDVRRCLVAIRRDFHGLQTTWTNYFSARSKRYYDAHSSDAGKIHTMCNIYSGWQNDDGNSKGVFVAHLIWLRFVAKSDIMIRQHDHEMWASFDVLNKASALCMHTNFAATFVFIHFGRMY